jgi:hypothetical protein
MERDIVVVEASGMAEQNGVAREEDEAAAAGVK